MNSKPQPLFEVFLARHGETDWSLSGQHTGRTDLPLTEKGRWQARLLGERLRHHAFDCVWTSPLQRAATTCALAGFENVAEKDPDLMEWDYGAYEGLKRDQILAINPNWHIFRDGCPNGESPAQAILRADRILARLRAASKRSLIFSSGHFLRLLAVRWLGWDPGAGVNLLLNTASLSILGFDHDRSEPAIQVWNDTHHLENSPFPQT